MSGATCCPPPGPAPIARADVANLADLAASLDYLKNKFPDPMWKAALRRAVRGGQGNRRRARLQHLREGTLRWKAYP